MPAHHRNVLGLGRRQRAVARAGRAGGEGRLYKSRRRGGAGLLRARQKLWGSVFRALASPCGHPIAPAARARPRLLACINILETNAARRGQPLTALYAPRSWAPPDGAAVGAQRPWHTLRPQVSRTCGQQPWHRTMRRRPGAAREPTTTTMKNRAHISWWAAPPGCG